MNSFLTKNLASDGKIIVKKARGITIWDINGKDYLDFSSQTLNLNLGQCHKELNQAVIKEIKKYTFLSSRFVNPSLEKLAKEIINIAPKGLNKINLKLSNGSDANESALKRVRKFTGKKTILSLFFSHLGESAETICASGKHFQNRSYIGGSCLFEFFHPPHLDFLPKCKNIAEAEKASLNELIQLTIANDDIAGIILEPIMVNAGVYILSPNYLKQVRRICDFSHIPLIFDEIQTGFGWLGDFFYSTKHKITPDIITLGKSIGAGFPLAGIIMKPEYDVLDYGEDEYTYGAHPLSCAAALKNIEILKKLDLTKIVKRKETLLQKGLSELMTSFSFIKEVRGEGLIWSITFYEKKSPYKTKQIYQRALDNGLILRKTQDGSGLALVLKPTILVSEDEISEGLKRLKKALN